VNNALQLGPGDPRQLGPYTILNRIGGGGMGVVYLGQTPDRRLVAVKVVRSDRASEPEFVARFRREVRAASGVAGFCTARVLAADLDAHQPYYVTEYVQGPTLQEAVEDGGPLAGRSLEAFAVGVAEALEAIHAAGVVHRDLKPSNVILAREGPKVIDFGIARPIDATTLTQTGKVVGSVNWLAPEQLRTGKASEASDVFAWGGLVTFAGTGHPPFGAGPVGTIANRILHEEPDLRGLQGRLLESVKVALSKDPSQRPSTRGLLEWLVGRSNVDPVTLATEVVQSTWMLPRIPAGVAKRPAGPQRASAASAWGGGVPGGQAAPGGQAGPGGGPGLVTPPMAGGYWPSREATPPVAPPPPPAAPEPTPQLDRRDLSSRPADGDLYQPRRDDPDRAERADREAEPARGRGAKQAYARGTVLADLLPGGFLRDLGLVAVFAVLIWASLSGDDAVSSARVTTAALVAILGAALLGRNRAGSGFTLGVVWLYLLGHGPSTGLRTLLGYLVLLVAIGVTGTIAAFGRRHKTIAAIVAVAVGFTALQGFLNLVGWDTFHLPSVNIGPFHGTF
jgi:Protein kinase domain